MCSVDKTLAHGFVPSLRSVLYTLFSRAIIEFLWLNKGSYFASVFAQQLAPRKVVSIPGTKKQIAISTHHGRLWWRAKGLLTEEPLIVDWIRGFTEDDVYLDIGANIGSYVLLAKALHPKIKVFAAELDFNNLYLLYHNLVVNALHENVILFPFPLSEGRAVSQVHYRDLSQGDALQSIARSSPFKTMRSKNAHVFTHLAVGLDQIIHEYGLAEPTMIKIDVDGNELAVLQGGRKTIRNAKMVYFEHSFTQECADFAEWLTSECGFFLVGSRKIYSNLDASTVVGENQLYANDSRGYSG
jgi:FkbM family methyltransferase